MPLPQLSSGAPQQQQHLHHHHSQPPRQRRQVQHHDDANTAAEPSARQSSPAMRTGSTRRLDKPQESTLPATPAAGAGALPVRDGYKIPRRRSLRLTKEKLDNPDDGSAAARSRGRNPKRSSPEVGSLGARAGRQFTVGNIGNNGLIYLRCVLPDRTSLLV